MVAKRSTLEPPQSLEAEAAVIGALLTDSGCVDDVLETVVTQDFYGNRHQIVFQAIVDLFKSGSALDYLTVSNHLKANEKLEQAGGDTFIAELIYSVPSSRNATHYAKIVKEKAMLRRIIEASESTIQEAYNQRREAREILDTAEKNILLATSRNIGKGYTKIQEVLVSTFERADRLHQSGSAVRGIPTGFSQLDDILSGLDEPDFIVLAARPGMGKTSLALNITRNVARSTGGVGFFSLEMSKEQLVDRMWSVESGVKLHYILTGQFSQEQEKSLLDAQGRLSELPIFIDDCASLNSLEFRTKARRLVAKEGVKLLIIDYLQLMQGATKTDNKNYEVSEISRSIKMVAKELNVPIIALSQLNRSVEYRGDRIPQLSDLRDSGSVEQDADIVMFIHRDDVVKGSNTNMAQIYIKKHRNGPLGAINLRYNPEYTSFENLV